MDGWESSHSYRVTCGVQYIHTGILGLLFVRQSVRTTGGRWPIFKQHNSKVSPFKNTYGLECGQIS